MSAQPVPTALGTFPIFIRGLDGKTITLTVSSNDTIDKIKQLIFETKQIPVDEQRLIFAGRSREGCRTLAEINVQRESTLHLTAKLRGGGAFGATLIFNDLTSKSEEQELAETASKWRYLRRGFNLEATCKEKGCPAFEKKVFVMLGMGKYNVKKAQLQAKCPITSTTVHSVAKTVETMCLFGCNYMILGMQLDVDGEGKEETKIEGTVSKDRWIRFDSENKVEWGYLEIETREL